MHSTALVGSHSAELSSHICISQGMSVANEIAGGSGTLCFEKQSTVPLPSLRLSCWPGVELVTIGACSQDAVTSDRATADSRAGSSPVAVATAATSSAPISPWETTGPGSLKTAGEDGTTPDPFPLLAMTSVSAATCACNSWTCFSRLARSETCAGEGFTCSASWCDGRGTNRLTTTGAGRTSLFLAASIAASCLKRSTLFCAARPRACRGGGRG